MANWFSRSSAKTAPQGVLVASPPPLALEPPPPPRPTDPVLERAVARVVHRALLALEAGDEATAREWVWALFHADLRRTI